MSSPASGRTEATVLKARHTLLHLRLGEPAVMGIVNIGNDSVADELRLATLSEQLDRAHALLEAGATIIDIGVQSGRTDTGEIGEQEEIGRLTPLVSVLAGEGRIVSVDTWRAAVAEAALDAGASIVNDVGGLRDPAIAELAARSGAGLVLMDTRAAPKTESFPGYTDPPAEVRASLQELMATALAAGVAEEQLILDPGLDYAKTPEESIAVLRDLEQLGTLGRPLLLAVSRKYFLGMITARPPGERLAATLAAVLVGVGKGAQIVRVHDVAETVDLLRVRSALLGYGPPDLLGDPAEESLKWLPPKGPE